MDYKMQADKKKPVKGRPILRIGERHISGIGTREAEIAKAILSIDICSHRRMPQVASVFDSVEEYSLEREAGFFNKKPLAF